MMNRRDLFLLSTAMGLTAAVPRLSQAGTRSASASPAPLPVPAEGSIPVAFVLSDDAVVIDFAGPWEVFENVRVPGRAAPLFKLYTVAETSAPVRATGGMTIVPDYTFATAPAPKVIVIPAQSDPDAAMLAWIRAAAGTADLTMSVCMGAFLLARTGLLSGQTATTHHSAYVQFQMDFPDIVLKRGARYVESGKLATAGGLSSGIDLALRVVERYCGRDVALRTADHLEYQGQGWLHPDANMAYAKRRVSTAQHPCCVVCEMDVDKPTAPTSVYRGRTYYFCMAEHKRLFDAGPARFLD